MDDGPPLSDRDLLRGFLAGRDVPCPGCGYNLRALTTDRCPECNASLAVHVGLVEPASGLLLTALLGLSAMGTGALFLLLGIVGLVSFTYKSWPSGDEFTWLLVVPGGVLVLDATALACLASRRGRRWFRALAPGRRRAIAAGCWALSITVFTGWLWGTLHGT